MKALLLLILPWLSPANYIDNPFSDVCAGFASHYGLTEDRKSARETAVGWPLSLTATRCPGDSAAATISLMTDEPGLDNPATCHGEDSPRESRKHARGTMNSLVWQKPKFGEEEGVVGNVHRVGVLNKYCLFSISAFPRLYHLIPDGEITSIRIRRVDPNESLSIRLVGGSETPLVHIIIQHIYRDGAVARDDMAGRGNLTHVLAINGHDLRHGSPESAAQLIQRETRPSVVSRQVRQQSPDVLEELGWDGSGGQCPGPVPGSSTPKPLRPAVGCREKVVSVRKEPDESLGMTVSGGASHREWDLPIYVISVEPGGVISRDGRIKTGDILLNVNGVELTEVSRSEAVALLKSTSSSVVLKALEVTEREPQADCGSPATLDSNHNVTPPSDWSPSWVMWLELPRYLYNCKDVILRRNTAGSLGFCIVGGYEEYNGDQPFFIKSIVEGTPAYNDGRIRCGDILLAVNGRSTSGMIHASLARMLKELKGRITLTIVSWPGTFL
uniref:Ligand of numb-protein X 1 n=1 Tax=Microcebus murinus TaxID=30608 RepID=A0A8C5UVU2_MICMU